jgi:hypothetical protein
VRYNFGTHFDELSIGFFFVCLVAIFSSCSVFFFFLALVLHSLMMMSVCGFDCCSSSSHKIFISIFKGRLNDETD